MKTTHNTPLIGGPCDLYDKDIVEEVEIYKIHQDGQVHQCTTQYMNVGEWIVVPVPNEYIQYRLHPHNELIQAHRDGAKIQAYICGDWVEESKPDWYEDTQYRIKPHKKTVYGWIGDTKWVIREVLFDEIEVSEYFNSYGYHKTDRSWEIKE